MNRNTAIVLAIVVASGIVLGYLFVLPLFEDEESFSTSVEFYDKDGNLVGSSISMAIYAGGAEVETMIVKVKWTVDASNIDPESFNAHIAVDIAVLNEDANVYEQLDSKSINSAVMVQTTNVEVYTWTLVDLLQEYMTDAHKTAGWTLRIKAVLTPTATDLAGNPVVPDPPTQTGPVVTADLTWVDTLGTMTIINFEVNRWLPLAP